MEGLSLEETSKELALIDSFVPWSEVLRVKPDGQLLEGWKLRQPFAKLLPWIILGGNFDTADVWLWLAIGSREVQFSKEWLDPDTDVDIPDGS